MSLRRSSVLVLWVWVKVLLLTVAVALSVAIAPMFGLVRFKFVVFCDWSVMFSAVCVVFTVTLMIGDSLRLRSRLRTPRRSRFVRRWGGESRS